MSTTLNAMVQHNEEATTNLADITSRYLILVLEKDLAQATLDTVAPKFEPEAATRLACRTE
jgi:hypothetical protein